MPKLLIIYAHPNHEGVHAYFLEQILDKLKATNFNDYEIIDLYAIKYNPILNNSELYSAGRNLVSPENLIFQNKIKTANRLLFVYPTWWQNMPAILKGFMDRIFVSGFAFVYKAGLPIGLLTNKKAAAFTATGGPLLYNRFFKGSQSLRALTRDILSFVGIKSRGFCLGSARKLDDNTKQRLEKMANKVLRYLLS